MKTFLLILTVFVASLQPAGGGRTGPDSGEVGKEIPAGEPSGLIPRALQFARTSAHAELDEDGSPIATFGFSTSGGPDILLSQVRIPSECLAHRWQMKTEDGGFQTLGDVRGNGVTLPGSMTGRLVVDIDPRTVQSESRIHLTLEQADGSFYVLTILCGGKPGPAAGDPDDRSGGSMPSSLVDNAFSADERAVPLEASGNPGPGIELFEKEAVVRFMEDGRNMATFGFANPSAECVVIDEIRTSCGCTSPEATIYTLESPDSPVWEGAVVPGVEIPPKGFGEFRVQISRSPLQPGSRFLVFLVAAEREICLTAQVPEASVSAAPDPAVALTPQEVAASEVQDHPPQEPVANGGIPQKQVQEPAERAADDADDSGVSSGPPPGWGAHPFGGEVEVASMRTRTSKHFRKPDGSMRAVVSLAPLHYRDSSGDWQNIVSELEAAPNTEPGSLDIHTIAGYPAVRIEADSGGYTVDTDWDGIAVRFDRRFSDVADTATEYRAKQSDERTVRVLETADGHVESHLQTGSGYLKHDIVLDQAPHDVGAGGEWILSWLVDHPLGVELEPLGYYRDDVFFGDLLLRDSAGAIICVIPEAVVFEGTDSLRQGQKGIAGWRIAPLGPLQWELSLCVSRGWLESAEYPVTIDPTVYVDASYSAYEKSTTYNCYYTSGSFCGKSMYLFAVSNPAGDPWNANVENRAFAKFELPQVLCLGDVTSARVDAYSAEVYHSGYVDLCYPLDQSSTCPSWSSLDDNNQDRDYNSNDCGWQEWVVTDKARVKSDLANGDDAWFSWIVTDYGQVGVVYADETVNGYEPYMTIVYTEDPPQCSVSKTSLSFGSAKVGCPPPPPQTFKIENTGGGTLTGNVSVNCVDFSVSPSGSFSLGCGASRTYTVTFDPQSAGPKTCTIDTGTSACSDVVCTGTGIGPSCSVSQPSLSFGDVEVGCPPPRTQTFTIENTGGGTLTGNVSENCVDFSVSPSGSFSLGCGDSQTYTVTFDPQSAGPKTCTIDTGTSACSDVVCTGTGIGPSCAVSTTSLSFGDVKVGCPPPPPQTFTIENTGGGTLTGNVSENCVDFSVSPSGSFSLGCGESRTYTVTFDPQSAGPKTCTIDTGTSACSDIVCTGTGIGPSCVVSTPSLSFSPTYVGATDEQKFTIRNDGGGLVQGSVTANCPDFSVLPSIYSLSCGSAQEFTVTFAPLTLGTKVCIIDTGCGSVTCDGLGLLESCSVVPTYLDFGSVLVGETKPLTFVIENTGNVLLSGVFGESCTWYSVSPPSYSLAEGENVQVTVEFAPPSAGTQSCNIDTGESACSDVACSGSGTTCTGGQIIGPTELALSECGATTGAYRVETASGTPSGGSWQVASGCLPADGWSVTFDPPTGTSTTATFAAADSNTVGTYECEIVWTGTCTGQPASWRVPVRFTLDHPCGSPPAPTALCMASVDSLGVGMEWKAPVGSGWTLLYSVYRDEVLSPTGGTLLAEVAGTSYRDATAVPGVAYWYWVKARSAFGSSLGSESNKAWVYASHQSPNGDINGDGTVDGIDLALLGAAWRAAGCSSAGASVEWNPGADVAAPKGSIDAADFKAISAAW